MGFCLPEFCRARDPWTYIRQGLAKQTKLNRKILVFNTNYNSLRRRLPIPVHMRLTDPQIEARAILIQSPAPIIRRTRTRSGHGSSQHRAACPVALQVVINRRVICAVSIQEVNARTSVQMSPIDMIRAKLHGREIAVSRVLECASADGWAMLVVFREDFATRIGIECYVKPRSGRLIRRIACRRFGWKRGVC